MKNFVIGHNFSKEFNKVRSLSNFLSDITLPLSALQRPLL